MNERPPSAANGVVGVRIEDVNLSFGETHVLRNVTLDIEPGEFFAFLGPSGCGKTTLLRLIAGFGQAQTGRVMIADEDVTGLPPWKRNVGMVFQSYALWPHMTVRRNVAFGLEERKISKEEVRRRVDTALELVGLLDLAERRPSQLSGGQQQRVALARTIVVEPQVLLLDEPLSNLDAKLRVQMRRELLELQRTLALTTIFVTHDQEEANTTADRIAVMDSGAIQQIGKPAELYDNPTNRFVADFLGVANVLDGEFVTNNGTPEFRGPEGIVVPIREDYVAALGGKRGGPCSAMFRPQNVSISAPPDPQQTEMIKMGGVIKHREFLGSLIRYSVAVGEQSILVDDAHQRGEPAFELGADVRLYVPQDQVVLLTS